MLKNYKELSVGDLQSGLLERRFTVVDIAESAITRLDQVDPELNAFIQSDADSIIKQAKKLDEKRASGRRVGSLFGVPYSLKMLTHDEGAPADQGLVPLVGSRHRDSAVVAKRLRAADGLFIGTTNAPSAGFYGGSYNNVYGATRNPWNLDWSAGGSSSGAAASVAAGVTPIAEAGDGAGSVRIPASFCGVVGFKPSMGRIPQELTGNKFASHVAHGPIARSVSDAAVLFNALLGSSERDPLSLPGTNEKSALVQDVAMGEYKVAYSSTFGVSHVDKEVARICEEALSKLSGAGLQIVRDEPDLEGIQRAMWHGIWLPDYLLLLELFDWEKHGDGIHPKLSQLVNEASELSVRDIARAQGHRSVLYDEFSRFMSKYEFLISPTLSEAAFSADAFTPPRLSAEPLQNQVLDWLMTYPANMFGNPAISIPAGFTADGRPVGLQITGRFRDDWSVLRFAQQCESYIDWDAMAKMERQEH